MKLLKRKINGKDSSGYIVVCPETNEDLWHLYNLIAIGDSIRSTTIRKVIKESTTGSTTSQRKRLLLTIQIQKISFDTENSNPQNITNQDNNKNTIELRYSGIVTSENDNVRLNSYHTVTVELYQNVSIQKDCWDDIFLNIIKESLTPDIHAEITVIVLQPTGICTICVIVGSLTITKAKINIIIPKKRTGSSQHSKATIKFFDIIYTSLVRHIDFNKMKCIIIGSPGFIKNDFYTYMIEQATKTNNKSIVDSTKSSSSNKFILTKSSSGYKHSIEELFNDPIVQQQMINTKILIEIQIIQKFMRLLDTNPDKAYYGYDHVRKVQIGDSSSSGSQIQSQQSSSSSSLLAIDTLLITDELIRSSNIGTRKKYIELVESVKAHDGTVIILSILHVPGQQLQQISGIAAILRYPIHDIDLLEALYTNSITTDSNSNNNNNQQQETITTTNNSNSNNIQYQNSIGESNNNTNDSDDDDDVNVVNEKRKAKLLQRIQEDVQDMGLL